MSWTAKEEQKYIDLDKKVDDTVSRVDVIETKQTNDHEKHTIIFDSLQRIETGQFKVLLVVISALLAGILSLLTLFVK